MLMQSLTSCLNSDVLYVHGNLASGAWFGPLAESLNECCKQEPVVNKSNRHFFADLLGAGEKSSLHLPENLSFELLAEDVLHSLLRDRKGHAPLILIGHSLGALVSLYCLKLMPKLFKALILIGSAPVAPIVVPQSLAASYSQMFKDEKFLEFVLRNTFYPRIQSEDFFQQVVLPDAKRALKSWGIKGVRLLEKHNTKSFVSELNVPTLIVHGEKDSVVYYRHAEELTSLFQGGGGGGPEFLLLKEQGHSPFLENPKDFAERIFPFVKKWALA